MASYKMYWLLGILEEVNLGNVEITFRRVIARIITGAWYQTLQYRLYFGQFDNLKKSIDYIASVYKKPANIKSPELLEFIYSSEDKILNKQMKELTYHVPYKLLTPFFDNKIKGTDGRERVRRIIELFLREAFSFICDNNRKKDLEQYVDMLRLENPIDFYKHKGKEGFSEKLRGSIAPIYQIAVNQGFSVIDKL